MVDPLCQDSPEFRTPPWNRTLSYLSVHVVSVLEWFLYRYSVQDVMFHAAVYGRWSEEGCTLVSVEGREITCMCDHLTHFGVLMVSRFSQYHISSSTFATKLAIIRHVHLWWRIFSRNTALKLQLIHILQDISPDERDNAVTLSLQVITYIGCIVSIVLLAILLLTYISLRYVHT